MRDRRKRNIIIGSLCCLLVFMGIGYALLSQTLNINGIANLTGKWKIYIDSITVKEVGGSAKSNQAEVTEDKLTANFDVELLKPGDYVEYDVVVKNEGTINAVLRELIPNIESNNMDILLTHSIIQGQILKAKSETKFTLKIRFDERATEIVNGGETSFDIQMVYEQYDGDTSSIVDGVVPVTANDCFTISDTGVITDYDYSCGTYVTIPAVVNGKNVTEISDTAFVQGNVILYFGEDADPSIVVAKDSDTYISFQALLEQMGGAEATGITLLLEGEELPDTTNLERIEADITETGELALPISKVEYLDLSQATGLENIVEGAFASDGRLQYLNLDESAIESFGEQALQFANLDTLTITTDMYSLIRDKFTATIDTLRIYPGSTTEIPDQQNEYHKNQITVNNLIIGEGITRIGNYTFSARINSNGPKSGFFIVNSVQFPGSLIEIGAYAFQQANLANLIIPDSVERIGNYAFYKNQELTNIIFQKRSKLKEIGRYAFGDCSLTGSLILEDIEIIGVGAFSGNKLEDVELWNINTIEYSAFFVNYKLTEVSINSCYGGVGVSTLCNERAGKTNYTETIYQSAFMNCGIEDLYVENVKTLDSYVFKNNVIGGTESIPGKTKWYINNIENIGGYAFQDNPLWNGPRNGEVSGVSAILTLCSTESLYNSPFADTEANIRVYLNSEVRKRGTLGENNVTYYSDATDGICK